ARGGALARAPRRALRGEAQGGPRGGTRRGSARGYLAGEARGVAGRVPRGWIGDRRQLVFVERRRGRGAHRLRSEGARAGAGAPGAVGPRARRSLRARDPLRGRRARLVSHCRGGLTEVDFAVHACGCCRTVEATWPRTCIYSRS